MTTKEHDRIEKRTVLRAPLERVWTALTDSSQFGRWFGSEFDGPFVAGQPVAARMVPSEVNAEGTDEQQQYAGMPWTAHIVAIEPMRRFAFRWNADAESAALTTVSFDLEETPDGVALTITESGFDALPQERRARTIESNTQGWDIQAGFLAAFLEQNP